MGQREAEGLEEAGDLDGAFEAWRRTLDEDPTHQDALAALDRLASAAGRWAELVAILERRAELADDPDAAAAFWRRAGTVARDQLGDDSAAAAAFRRADELTA